MIEWLVTIFLIGATLSCTYGLYMWVRLSHGPRPRSRCCCEHYCENRFYCHNDVSRETSVRETGYR